MKKTILISLLFFMLINQNKAQTTFSVAAGANQTGSFVVNGLRIDHARDGMIRQIVRPFFAVNMEKKINNKWSFGLQAQVQKKGLMLLQKYLSPLSDVLIYDEFSALYLDFSPTIIYNFSKYANIYTGVSTSIKLRETYCTYNTPKVKSPYNTFTPFDIGYVFGLKGHIKSFGIYIQCTNSMFSVLSSDLQTRYPMFFYEQFKNPNPTKYFNQTLQVGLDIPFETFKKVRKS